MNTSATIEGAEHVPGKPTLVIPNRVDMAVLCSLEELLGGDRKITWLVEDSLRPGSDIMNYMKKKRANGILFRVDTSWKERLQAIIKAELAAGRHVALLPGIPQQPLACHADVPMDLLHFILDEYTDAVLPIYAGAYNPGKAPMVVNRAPYEKLLLRVLRPVSQTAGAAGSVFAAWLEAASSQISQLAKDSADTLPQALLRSLLAHADSTIIDGVDDSRMSYRQLVIMAASLVRYLKKHTASKRLGIILPPGKLAIIANVACILAGITPVNIDYSYDKAALTKLTRQAELTRFITEHCFIDMQRQFPWPWHRDMLFIDEALATSSFRVLSRWNFLKKWLTPGRIAKWIRMTAAEPQDEALAVFTPAEDGNAVRSASLSHRAVLTGAALCYSRFGLKEGQRVLSTLPFHYHASLLAGLIYPLLMGQDIITYPIPNASKRLCHLARQYAPSLAVFTPKQAYEVLSQAQENDFSSTACLHVIGKIPTAMGQQIYDEKKVFLCECYLPLEATMPVACNMAPPSPGENPSARTVVASAIGSCGMLLPGMALRITDIDRPDTPISLSSPGLVWIKGPGISPAPSGSRENTVLHTHDRWYCTGDIGYIRPDGLLAIGGPRTRFSKVKGEILSHEKIERLMAKFLRIDEADGTPRLAVVGLPDAEGGDAQIVLLSTVHKVVGPHDVITLRYDITNAHYPSHWAPAHIVALRAIPTLPSGKIDYDLCLALAHKALGISRP